MFHLEKKIKEKRKNTFYMKSLFRGYKEKKPKMF